MTFSLSRKGLARAGAVAAFVATAALGLSTSASAATSGALAGSTNPKDGSVTFTSTTARATAPSPVTATAVAAASTWVLTGYHTYTLLGTRVMQHVGRTTFSCGTVLTTPRSLSHSGSTAPGFTIQSAGTFDRWNYYTSSLGQSQHTMTFLFGIPTPWGGVGSTYVSTMLANLHANCSSSWTL